MLSLVCLFACNGEGEGDAREELGKVESIMESRPDSAYSLLCDFDKRKLKTVRDTALYRLLWAEGRYKTFHDDTVSDGIDKSVLFFRDAGERRNLMRALFYQGIIRKNAGAYGAAMLSFIEGKEYPDSTDWFFRGKLYTAMSEVSNEVGDVRSFEEEAKKALECFEKTDSIDFIEDAKLWYAMALTYNGKYDNGVEMMKDVFSAALSRCDSNMVVSTACQLGRALLWENKYEESRSYFSLYSEFGKQQEMDIRDKNLLLLTMIRDSVKDGSVHAIAQEIESDYGKENVLHEYFLYTNDYRSAYNSLRKEYSNLDLRYGAKARYDGSFIIQQYQNNLIASANKELKLTKERDVWIIVALVALFVVAFLFTSIVLYVKSKRIEELLTVVAILSKNSASDDKGCDFENLGSSFGMMKRIFMTLDVFYSEYYRVSDNEKKRKGLLSRMGEEVEKLRCDEELLEGLELEINKESNGLLESVYGGLNRRPTADQRRLIVFLYMNISVDALCLLFDVRPESLYNRKSRLIKRITESTSSRKDELISLIS